MREARTDTPSTWAMASSRAFMGLSSGMGMCEASNYRFRDYAASALAIQAGGPIPTVKTPRDTDPPPESGTLGERLAWARRRRKLTQQQLAAAAGTAQSTIGSAEKGHRGKPRELVSLARALRVYPYWLDTGRGPWDAAHAPETVFEQYTDMERELLENFRLLVGDDRLEMFQEMKQRADRARAYAREAFVSAGVQIPAKYADDAQQSPPNTVYPADEPRRSHPAIEGARLPGGPTDGNESSKHLSRARKGSGGRA